MAVSFDSLVGRLRGKTALLVYPYPKLNGARPPGRALREEFALLAESCGLLVVGSYLPGIGRINPATYLGRGQVEKVRRMAEELSAQVVVLAAPITPVHQRNLEERLGRLVIGRSELIFQVFMDRAHTHEGRVQVELARLRYDLPRISMLIEEQSRTGGGIGTVGPGQTTVEVLRTRVRRRIRQLENQIEKLRRGRDTRRKRRVRSALPLAALVGYTNVGKSTLFNRLTSAEVEVDDRYFATLDPTVRRMGLPDGRSLLITDTVGFIHELPEELMDAFRATLDELSLASFLIVVEDLATEGWEERLNSVEKVLAELQVDRLPRLLVFNKVDLVDDPLVLAEARSRYPEALLVSARTSEGIGELILRLMEMVDGLAPQRGVSRTGLPSSPDRPPLPAG